MGLPIRGDGAGLDRERPQFIADIPGFGGPKGGIGPAASFRGEAAAAEGLPEWLRLLPQFLRYGVASRELVWVMSLGIPDPSFAAWMVLRVREAEGDLTSFRGLVSWLLEHRMMLIEATSREWPRYFRKTLAEVFDRYEVLTRSLEAE